MKRITALFSAALLALAMTGCDNKNNDNELPTEATEEVTEEVSESEYLELSDDDFVDIDMNLRIIDDEPPVTMNVADLSKIDFGERMTPCKAEEYREKYGMRQDFGDNTELQEQYDREREKFFNTPSGGSIQDVEFIDGIFYFSVNYDDLCGRHDSALYRFDPRTEEYKELDRRCGMEYNGCYMGLTSAGGRLFFFEHDDRMTNTDPEHSVVYSVDPKTGEVSEFLNLDYTVYWLEDTANGLYISGSIDVQYLNDEGLDTSGLNGEVETEGRYAYYDPETGLKLDYSEQIKYSRFWGTCDGVPVEVTGGIDDESGEPITIKTQYYTLKTKYMNADNIFAWKDRVSILIDEGGIASSEKRLYTYEIASRERTKLKFDGFGGNHIKTGEGFFSLVSSSDYSIKSRHQPQNRIFYTLPKYGTAFRLDTVNVDSNGELRSGDIMYIITVENEQEDNDSMFYIGMYSHSGKPDKLYWFDMRE